MEQLWRSAVSRQYGTLLDGLESVIRQCPDSLWESSIWVVRREDAYVWPPHRTSVREETPEDQERLLQVYSAFWNVVYHALFHIDFYLSGGELPFKAPAPFREADHRANTVPDRVFTPQELLAYVAHNRKKSRELLVNLSDEDAGRMLKRMGQPYAELVVHNLVHAFEHLGQLRLFLGQGHAEVAPPARSGPAQMLRDRVRQRSDAEIDIFAASLGGYDRLLPMVFDGMAQAVQPGSAAVVRFEVGRDYHLRVGPKGGKHDRKATGEADATLRLSPQDFLRLVTEDIDFAAAIGDGRIVADGDPAAIGRVFGRAQSAAEGAARSEGEAGAS